MGRIIGEAKLSTKPVLHSAMSAHPNLRVFETFEQLATAAAERFVECAAAGQSSSGRFSVALSGGNTPKRVYELLATDGFRQRVDWSRVQLFFGDERAVPPDHADSNFRMANNALIAKVAIPPENVHRINGELDPDAAAANYEDELRSLFRDQKWPRFDLIFLGLGEDGHTASLFPGSRAMQENVRWVVATRNPATGQDRITLTVPVLNHARQITFLVLGQNKAQRLRDVFSASEASQQFPAQAVRPVSGNLEWLVDNAAASLL
jgi:6-phosphogluconolactonase